MRAPAGAAPRARRRAARRAAQPRGPGAVRPAGAQLRRLHAARRAHVMVRRASRCAFAPRRALTSPLPPRQARRGAHRAAVARAAGREDDHHARAGLLRAERGGGAEQLVRPSPAAAPAALRPRARAAPPHAAPAAAGRSYRTCATTLRTCSQPTRAWASWRRCSTTFASPSPRWWRAWRARSPSPSAGARRRGGAGGAPRRRAPRGAARQGAAQGLPHNPGGF
jgi:hypothetical protein